MNNDNGYSDPNRMPALVRFMIGRDHGGRWVVEDRLGLLGGLFVSKGAALHFALHEADYNEALVDVAPDGEVVELHFTGGPWHRSAIPSPLAPMDHR